MKALFVLLLLASTAAAQSSPTPQPPPEWVRQAEPRLFYAISGGTGTGIIGGKTEGLEADVETGLQWAPFHLRAELAAFRTSQLAFGIHVRLGWTPKTDTDPPVAKAVMLRVYRMCRPVGLRFHGDIGAGYIRYRVGVNGTDIDSMAAGPVLFGAGAGYVHKLSRSWHLIVDATAIGAIATSDKYGGVRNEHALHFDLDVGLALFR
jgi:hypothetical protein